MYMSLALKWSSVSLSIPRMACLVAVILIRQAPSAEGWVAVRGKVDAVTYLGAITRYTVALEGGGELTVVQQNADDRGSGPAAGGSVWLTWQGRHQQQLAAVLP